MSKIDIQLQYQKTVGVSLDSIKDFTENNKLDTQAYIDWLENQIGILKKRKDDR